MNKIELMQTIGELIVNNSNIEAAEYDAMILGVEDVQFNASSDDADVTIVFEDGKVFTLTVTET